jgi:hypothetical protein
LPVGTTFPGELRQELDPANLAGTQQREMPGQLLDVDPG